MAKDDKLYVFVSIKKKLEVDYYLNNKFVGFKIALDGKLCNLGNLEPCDANLIKIRN